MSGKKVLLSWSTGKDSYWALHRMRQQPEIQVAALVTTFNSAFDRVAMHAVRRSLAEAQAARLGLPVWPVELPWPCSNSAYEERMACLCKRALTEGITAVAFGDLFLQDIRDYREKQLLGTGLEPIFPLWQLPTGQLAREMIDGGLKARVTCVDPAKMDRSAAGREYNAEFLASLPDGVDHCGENGEFHTFVYDGPLFSRAIDVTLGEIVERDSFVFADLQPGNE